MDFQLDLAGIATKILKLCVLTQTGPRNKLFSLPRVPKTSVIPPTGFRHPSRCSQTSADPQRISLGSWKSWRGKA